LFKQVSITILELVAIVDDDISCKFMVRKDETMLDYNLYNRENTIGEEGRKALLLQFLNTQIPNSCYIQSQYNP
jgi:hypothetical protein